ncbi:ABC transporter permease [Sebaldella sp. S0638]|uniref:ABC transporter permease n=1 Tax=Sebaldella sp. S0638 TaxID=2957809 RepID=UPI0020A1ACF5|nr:ABC transporter permease [Sebaldella sp. S0638]MCP1223390.1 ABC transporter permease [Sebaldella sp. S0638]
MKLSKYIKDIYKDKDIVIELAVNDFKNKYSGSYFGIVWAFIQPIVTILVFWFVFEVGFRAKANNDIPFVLWLTAGLIPWFFFSDALNSMTYSFLEYAYLVKKVVFKIELLPLVKLLSSLFVHFIFIILMVILLLLNKYSFSLYLFQLFYYTFCTLIFVFSIGLFTASVTPFFKDFGQIITIFLQFGMWLTPIMWQVNILPPRYVLLFKLNPMFYIIQGYRDSIFYNIGFWNYRFQTLYFWSITIVLVLISVKVYKKTNQHFSDVI